jgi:hypothetical protein
MASLVKVPRPQTRGNKFYAGWDLTGLGTTMLASSKMGSKKHNGAGGAVLISVWFKPEFGGEIQDFKR